MPSNKHALIRYRVIDNSLRNKFRKYPTLERLKESCDEALGDDFHLSTIQKDLDAMRNDGALGYNAPIAYSKYYKGYYYTDPEFSINSISLDEDALSAIQFAASTLHQFRDTDIFQDFQSALDRILEASKLRLEKEPDEIETVIQFEKSPFVKGNELLSQVMTAIRQHVKIEFNYKRFDFDKTKHHVVHPYLLKEFQERWYVIGFLESIQKVTTFGLDRMSDLKLLEDQTFSIDDDFDAKRHFHDVIGISLPKGKPEKVVLSFTPFQANYIQTKPIHHSQKVVSETSKEVKVRLNIIPNPEFYMQLLSWGPEVKVLQPLVVKNELKRLLRSTLKNYSK